jgi:small neutral amino acid transporter SnatA (MarC family)
VILAKSYGAGLVLASILLNLVIVWLVLHYTESLTRWVGMKRMSIISKIAGLILVSIAVMMIRVGIRNS